MPCLLYTSGVTSMVKKDFEKVYGEKIWMPILAFVLTILVIFTAVSCGIFVTMVEGGEEKDSLWQVKLDSICMGLHEIFPEKSAAKFKFTVGAVFECNFCPSQRGADPFGVHDREDTCNCT